MTSSLIRGDFGLDNGVHYKLSALEVLEYWKLDVDLVTLSACETGLGPQAGGDGILGFSQAFLLAGSRSVCLSLWKLDDTAAALLMTRFYSNLKANQPKSIALSEAKSWLRNLTNEEVLRISTSFSDGVLRGKQSPILGTVQPVNDPKNSKPFAHPWYWASFILFGDPD